MHLDTRIVVATPEAITLELVLAGLGSRFVARLIDSAIQIAIILALSFGAYVVNGSAWDGYVTAGIVVLTFLVVLAYDIPFEVLANGRTPGKGALGIRVVGRDGGAVDFVTSAVRNLLRIVDFLPVMYLVGSISIVATQHSQRLGDLAGGTLVARDRFGGRALDRQVSAPVSVPLEQVLTWDVSAVDAEELRVLRHFLDRRLNLPWPIRSYFAGQLLERFWPKVPGLPMNVHPEYILEGIVVAKQGRAVSIQFTQVRGRDLRIAGIGLVAAAALWRVSPVHPPLVCPLRNTTGIPCPFCGMTRAVVAAVHGDLLGSLRFNPGGVFALLLVAYVIIRARLPRTRAPVWLVVGVLGALWAYNIVLNPTFT